MFDALAKAHIENETRKDRRAYTTSVILANVYRDRSQHPEPYSLEDFVPRLKRKQTPEDMLRVITVINSAFGGKVIVKDENG